MDVTVYEMKGVNLDWVDVKLQKYLRLLELRNYMNCIEVILLRKWMVV